MARLTFPRFDPTVSLDNHPFVNDPEIKRLTRALKQAAEVRDRLHDAHRKAMGFIGDHDWQPPKDPKVKKAMLDARKAADDARIELRQALKERGIDIGAQHQANMDLLKKLEVQSREAMRKLGLEHTIDRLEREGASTSMGRLIEACELEVDEDASALIPAVMFGGPLAAGAIAGARAFRRDAQADNAERNKAAERGQGRCADGYNMVGGKCVPTKGLANKIKRSRIKNFFTGRD